MDKLKKYIPYTAAVLLVLLGIGISYMQQTQQPTLYKKIYIDIFDTATQILGYADDEETFTQQAEQLKEKLETYHKYYNIYTSYENINNLRTINKNAGIAPVKVEPEIIDLLKFSIELYEQTNGKINIAMGSVLSIWHDYRTAGINEPENATLPPMEALEEAALHTDIYNIIIDEEASTVYLADAKMSLDVGSIGKGYAVQMVAEYAEELGYNHLVINCGGNVAAIGTRADGSLWKFGIQNPDLNASNDIIQTVNFADNCLVTSGDYQRYYVVDGVEYCHIIQPDTLMPANYFRSVSIICPHSGMADALSTALFNMPYEEGFALIESIENAEAVWIFHDGTIRYSSNFQNYLVK